MSQNKHDHKHVESHHQQSAGSGIHRDWRFWGVIAMLVAIAIYVFSMDESLEPEGEGEPVPAADAL